MKAIYVSKWRTDIQFSCVPEISCAKHSKTLSLQTEFMFGCLRVYSDHLCVCVCVCARARARAYAVRAVTNWMSNRPVK